MSDYKYPNMPINTYGSAPLIAAMRCYVMGKLGAIVESKAIIGCTPDQQSE